MLTHNFIKINGKDFYFDGEEAVKRLKARAAEKMKELKKSKKKVIVAVNKIDIRLESQQQVVML